MSHERLRQACNLASVTAGADQWTAEEWLVLHAAYVASGFDIPPDGWTRGQVAAALALGLPPRFDDGGRPIDRPDKGAKRLPTAERPRSIVRDSVMRALVVGHAVEAYAAEQWKVFQGWAELLDESGKQELVEELRKP